MHKYSPRIRVALVNTDDGKPATCNAISNELEKIFIFPETEFIAVTTYLNEQVNAKPIKSAYRKHGEFVNLRAPYSEACFSFELRGM